jgi:hypothetical protein
MGCLQSKEEGGVGAEKEQGVSHIRKLVWQADAPMSAAELQVGGRGGGGGVRRGGEGVWVCPGGPAVRSQGTGCRRRRGRGGARRLAGARLPRRLPGPTRVPSPAAAPRRFTA